METNSKMLERVRALLAKADSTNFPAEADSFRAKADALMATYAIQQWQVDQAQGGVGQTSKPERRDVDMSWWYNRKTPARDELWELFHDVAHHCRCVVVLRGIGSGGRRTIPVIGLASDLGYFDMLFTHLMLQMGKGLEPKPQPGQSYIEAIVQMKEAGMKWERIGELLIEAGLMEGPYTRNVGVRFTREYAQDCKSEGRPQLRVAPSVWQRSYAEGFVDEVGRRFLDMRRLQREATKDDGKHDALAVQDMRKQAHDLANELFPPPEGKKSTGSYISRDLVFNQAAHDRGKAAGRKADISGSPSRGLRNQKELKS